MIIDVLLLSICRLKICCGPHRCCSCTLEAKCLALFLASKRHHLVEKEVIEIKCSTHDRQTMDRVQRRKELTLRVGRVRKGCSEKVLKNNNGFQGISQGKDREERPFQENKKHIKR